MFYFPFRYAHRSEIITTIINKFVCNDFFQLMKHIRNEVIASWVQKFRKLCYQNKRKNKLKNDYLMIAS